ncbi:type VI secretion system tube protein Hcp [Phenylobacterium sp.]|uniref:type VI secretion system tube protein Hcp n=1 Tax=Phenylobacterium sp. TaxID=1871053 RepID=UPI0025CD5E26|nr:type VI secretion system tube protein Hcp [Phenylobacterium sp.]
MALKYFLEVEGLSGSSTAEAFLGAFDVIRFSFDVTHTDESAIGGGSFGINTYGGLRITLANEAGLTAFLDLVATQHRTSSASLIAAGPIRGELQELQRINLSNVVVSEVFETNGSGFVVVLNYHEIGFVDQHQNPDGTLGTPDTFGFDPGLVTTVPVPPPAHQGPGITAVTANHYFLLVDGVDGGSTDPHHLGWFDLPIAVFDVTSLFTRARAARPPIGPTSTRCRST